MKLNIYIPLLLLFILGDVMCDNFIFRTFHSQAPARQLFLFMGLLLIQSIAAPIQAGFSDFFCRKKSLVISLIFSLFSLVLQYLYNQEIFPYFFLILIMVFSKGLLGNTIPLSWAAIADTQEKNVRFSFALSTGSFAVAYLLMIFTNKFLSGEQSSILVVIFFVILLFSCMIFFKDIRDRNDHPSSKVSGSRDSQSVIARWGLILNDLKLIIKDLTFIHTRNALLAFLLWEISLYIILLLYVDFDVPQFSSVALAMVFGYIFGVLLLKIFQKADDSRMIKWGYNISAISLLPFLILFPFNENPNFNLLSACYFFHMVGNAFLSATLFSILAHERKVHEQGRIYGLIASVDTIAFLLSSISVIIYNAMQLNIIYIIAISFLSVTVSWFPYAKFERTRPKELSSKE